MLELGGFWKWFASLFERLPPGILPEPQKCEKVSIFDPKTYIFQIKKAGIPSCFLNIFGKKTDDTVQKNRSNTCCSGEKCEHFVLFFANLGKKTAGTVQKKNSIPSCFLNIFGEKPDNTVPKNRSEVISQLKRAGIPFCFFIYF